MRDHICLAGFCSIAHVPVVAVGSGTTLADINSACTRTVLTEVTYGTRVIIIADERCGYILTSLFGAEVNGTYVVITTIRVSDAFVVIRHCTGITRVAGGAAAHHHCDEIC